MNYPGCGGSFFYFVYREKTYNDNIEYHKLIPAVDIVC